MSASEGLSPAHYVALRAIAAGKGRRRMLEQTMKPYVSGVTLDGLLQKLVDAGLLAQGRGFQGPVVTRKGLSLLAGKSPAFVMTPYTPAVPAPRRPGSDVASRLPSMMGGQLVSHRA